MDEADKAQQEREQQLSITLTKKKQEQEIKQTRPSADNCTDCDDPIPVARQLVEPGCQRCVACKERFELLQKRIKHA